MDAAEARVRAMRVARACRLDHGPGSTYARFDSVRIVHRHRLVALVVGICVAAVGFAAAPAGADLGIRLTAKGQALAQRFALRGTDVPSGFKALPAQQSQSSLRCPHFTVKLDDLTVNGRAVRAFARTSGDASLALVVAAADVFVDEPEAQALLGRVFRPGLVACVEREMVATIGAGTHVSLLRSRLTHVAGVRGHSQELAATFSTTAADGRTTPASCTIAAEQSGRLFALVVTAGLGEIAVPSGQMLLARMSSRMPPAEH